MKKSREGIRTSEPSIFAPRRCVAAHGAAASEPAPAGGAHRAAAASVATA